MTATASATTSAAPFQALADFADVLPDLAAHAQAQSPRECCGVVVVGEAGMVYMPCGNLEAGHAGHDRFVIDPADYARAEDAGEIIAIAHSHPYADANPSEADRVMCERTGLPWLIMGWPSQVATLTLPVGYESPMIGRSFHHGILDCYTLIQDYYERTLGIALPYFERSDEWWMDQPDKAAQDLYTEGFPAAGFEAINAVPQLHDVLLMQVRSNKLNHAAIYLGNGVILHHLHGRPSTQDVYGGYWERHTGMVLRHKEVIAQRAKGGEL